MGSFGGWLTHLSQDGEKYRLFFNGKQNQLAFEKSQKHGGWELLSSMDIPDEGVAGFAVAVIRLLKVD